MIKVVVKVGEEELPYEFSEAWQVEWLVRFLNWYLGLSEVGVTKRVLDGILRLAQFVGLIHPARHEV